MSTWSAAPAAWGLNGAVVSPHFLASEAGASVLAGGGNAVDAAIATNAALSVVASNMCGLGGDAFWLIWDPTTRREYALNGSGRSAAAATLEAASEAGLNEMPLHGPWSVTVPGAVRSWGDAHDRFGRLAWADLLAPAVALADGFPATPRWRDSVERAVLVFGKDSEWASVFRPAGRPWQPGERVVLRGLAASLRQVAAEGATELYTGSLARRTAAYLVERGSPIRLPDLESHRSSWMDPIVTTYRGVTVTSHPPNSAGAVALELLNILDALDSPVPKDLAAGDAQWIHFGLEAARLVLGDRDAELTDPEHMARGGLELILDRERARTLARMIDPVRVVHRRPPPVPARGGTVYLATADRWGGVVSLIESNYMGFGSGLVDPETGIAFQNRGAFFVLDAAHRNVLAPRKRTMHTLAPGMLLRDGRPWIAHGSMGGEIQPQIFAQFVSGVVDGGLSIAEALALPRWAANTEQHYGPASRTVLERRFPVEVAQALTARGHRVEWSEPYDSAMGHAHAIEIVDPSRAGPKAGDPGPVGSMPERRGSDGVEETPVAFFASTDPRSDGLPRTL